MQSHSQAHFLYGKRHTCVKLGEGVSRLVLTPRLSSRFLKGEVGGALLVVRVYLPRHLQYLCVELLDLTPVQ